ncbi:MAG: phosphatidylserine decarboxylase family protein [Candidatus Kapabacteria bacterium]|nr:phosphatidylserine decarboxylase family protein [Candidatus Kapabacteria bacterium]
MLTKYGTDNILVMLLVSFVLMGLGLFVFRQFPAYIFLGLGLIIFIFTIWFFRDPDRKLPTEAETNPALIIAPADGKIVEIKDVEENLFLHSKAKQISIFLSPLDVHVNRIPFGGTVKFFSYNPGDYLVAYHPKSSELNEQTRIGVENKVGKIFFKQITGILARRIVWDIKIGDTVAIGQRFGMMKFGSRMDIMVPLEVKIFVNKGDRVVAGESIIGSYY